MPIIFKVVDPKNTPSEYFAYNDDAQPIGDPSVYARVYQVYPSNRDGLNLNAREASQWIVKENQSPTEDRRFIAEYELMQKLAQSTQQRAGSAFSPYPVFRVERIDTGVQSIVMPYYTTSFVKFVREETQNWHPQELEMLLIEQAINYLHLLEALPENNALTDRKLGDFFWHDNHLVVIDWNLLQAEGEAYRRAELSLLVRLWYSLVTKKEPRSTLNAFDDKEWQTIGDADEAGLYSLGLRTIFAKVTRGKLRERQTLRTALEGWLEILKSASPTIEPTIIGNILKLNPVQTKAVMADLRWRLDRSPDNAKERASAIRVAITDMGDLGEAADIIAQIKQQFLRGEYTKIQNELIAEIQPDADNDVQKAARARWQHLAKATSILTMGGQRELRLEFEKLREQILVAVDRLQHDVGDDASLGETQPLRHARSVFQQAADLLIRLSDNNNEIKYILAEIDIRDAYLAYQQIPHHEMSKRSAALRQLLATQATLPYRDYLLDVTKLKEEQLELDSQLTGDQALKDALQAVQDGWKSALGSKNFIALDTAIAKHEKALSNIDANLHNSFLNQVQPFKRCSYFFATLDSKTIEDLRREDIFWQEKLQPQVVKTLRELASPILEKHLIQVETLLLAPKREDVKEADKHLLQLKEFESSLSAEYRQLYEDLFSIYTNYRNYLKWESANPQADAVQRLTQARQYKIDLTSPIIARYTDELIQQTPQLKANYESLNQQVQNELSRLTNTRTTIQQQLGQAETQLQASIRGEVANVRGELVQTVAGQVKEQIEQERAPITTKLRTAYIVIGIVAIVFLLVAVGLAYSLWQTSQSANAFATQVADTFLTQTEIIAATVSQQAAYGTETMQANETQVVGTSVVIVATQNAESTQNAIFDMQTQAATDVIATLYIQEVQHLATLTVQAQQTAVTSAAIATTVDAPETAASATTDGAVPTMTPTTEAANVQASTPTTESTSIPAATPTVTSPGTASIAIPLVEGDIADIDVTSTILQILPPEQARSIFETFTAGGTDMTPFKQKLDEMYGIWSANRDNVEPHIAYQNGNAIIVLRVINGNISYNAASYEPRTLFIAQVNTEPIIVEPVTPLNVEDSEVKLAFMESSFVETKELSPELVRRDVIVPTNIPLWIAESYTDATGANLLISLVIDGDMIPLIGSQITPKEPNPPVNVRDVPSGETAIASVTTSDAAPQVVSPAYLQNNLNQADFQSYTFVPEEKRNNRLAVALNGFNWYLIRKDDGTVGWVREDVVNIEYNVNSSTVTLEQ